MIAATARVSQDRLLRLAQFGALLLASLVVIAFIRFHLVSSARSFRQDFERQSFIELGQGEAFIVARKLAALGKSEQFSCISATKAGIVFFEEKNASCEAGFFSVEEIVRVPNNQIEIAFTIRLQSGLFWGLVVFLLAQAALAAMIYLSQARLVFLRTESDLALAALAQQVAHDLQAPLAILLSLKHVEGRENFEQLSLQQRALRRLKQLVGHLQGRSEKEQLNGSLAVLLSMAVQEKKAEFAQGRVPSIEIEWALPLGNKSLVGSAFEWRRVFSNLLNNAIEASELGKEIQIEVSEVSNEKISVSIKDMGKGMSPNALKQLGVSGYTKGKIAGKGLGFFLAKKYVYSVGGSIEVTSSEGVGTNVRLEIPSLNPNTAVLVDDDADLAVAWQLAAKHRGIALQHYLTLDEFLAAKDGLPKQTPIFLDLEFPGSKKSSLEVGSALFVEGFTSITLATGRPQSQLLKPEWALAVIGKDPPWL